MSVSGVSCYSKGCSCMSFSGSPESCEYKPDVEMSGCIPLSRCLKADVSKLNFSVHLSGKAPNCPYNFLPCKKFYVYLAYAVCSKDETRCSELPSWVSNGYNLAVLRGEVLHV